MRQRGNFLMAVGGVLLVLVIAGYASADLRDRLVGLGNDALSVLRQFRDFVAGLFGRT